MGEIIFRGVSTASLDNVYVQRMPDHRKAGKRYTEYYVKGRDGAVHVDEGFANFELTATLVLVNGEPGARQIVNAWADGTGKLITSDQPGLAYIATVEQEIDWSRVSSNKIDGEQRYHDTARITWNCQPFMYQAVDTVIILTESQALINPGSAEAFPLIEVNGSGDVSFSVNGNEITISGMTANVPVTIDSENGYVYTPSGATEMTGEFPVFELGTNTVTVGTGVSSLRITPKWRWV